MERAVRLRKNRQFQYVYHRGKSAACREIVLLYAKAARLQVGFSVSRKVGNSVVRNRTKRRLREQFRRLMPQLRAGLYVIVAREAAARTDSEALYRALLYAAKKQGLLQGLAPGRAP